MNQNVLIALSDVDDGSMSKGVELATRDSNRMTFLEKSGISLEQTVLVHLTYESHDFTRYKTIDSSSKSDGIIRDPSSSTDALFTQEKGLALFLPIADCIGMVMYDSVNHVLGLSHLGRHNLVQKGGSASIRYMKDHFGTEPHELEVWLSPAAGKSSYPLNDFKGQSLHEVATEQLLSAGADMENIVIDDRDTTKDESLFSHSEFLKKNRSVDGRQSVVAMMHS